MKLVGEGIVRRGSQLGGAVGGAARQRGEAERGRERRARAMPGRGTPTRNVLWSTGKHAAARPAGKASQRWCAGTLVRTRRDATDSGRLPGREERREG